ncbi:hypothetical protein GQ53DRAFT_747709 [Thozetella sp. PMI_491]|nr:hypothetical protein GQ53DRAFT_747709 [Thozetella sp. PMI_491]
MDRPPPQSVAEILAQDKRPRLGLTSSLLAFYAILAPACLVCAATKQVLPVLYNTPSGISREQSHT